MLQLDAQQKAELIELLKAIKIDDGSVSNVDKKRKWFRFGAYDALRIATEQIQALPEKTIEHHHIVIGETGTHRNISLQELMNMDFGGDNGQPNVS